MRLLSIQYETEVLNETHFDSHHLYTLEWQPGIGGYLYWWPPVYVAFCVHSWWGAIFSRYLDDELILGIDGSSLEKLNGAMIPTVSELLFILCSIMWCPIHSYFTTLT